MAHIALLRSMYSLKDRPVVDIGAGDGVYAKQLYEEGAYVTAIEVDPTKVSNAKSNIPPGIDVLLGAAEKLPLKTNSQQLACFFFSLHHVPADLHRAAFDEVRRVLRSGGRLHVVEPYPFGTMFDVVRMVEDETFVRTNSHNVLDRLDEDQSFKLLAKNEYILTREYPTFEFFLDKIVRPDPDRYSQYKAVASDMRHTFERVIENVDGKRVLHQPCASYHFQVFS